MMSESNDTLAREFADPGVAWRGKPFWSWNGRLEEAELLRQIDVLRDMGMGGYFMHSRTGLVTEYLGEEWFRLTNACADHGAARGMQSWLYDEDRWPSGTAGGIVTADPAHRIRFLTLRPVAGGDFHWSDDLVAAFACKLDGIDARTISRIGPGTPSDCYAERTVLAFTIEPMAPQSFYNGNTYVDTMSRAATDEYIRLTHERYAAHCGDRLGSTIQGIFTDEPHRGPVLCGFGLSNEDRLWMAPWTGTLPEEFQRRFGYDLMERLPDLFLRPDGAAVSPVKWHYMELTQQLFLENYARPLYEWCDAHQMRLTGHVLHEDSLTAQAAMQGSLMRFYEYLHYPGIDVLTEGNRCYWIAKQLQSAARQLGQRWLLSELYGCTGWQFDFAAHKAVGDWQALLGINVRCHHLSWYTMAGEAKRDYPASILHQSAWWRDYAYVEDYFARLGVLLAQGERCCEVLVLNPVESIWCRIHAGWADGLAPRDAEIEALEAAYTDLFHTLAGAQIDFDYGDEEMLGRLGAVERDAGGAPILRLGLARYRSVVLGRMTTLRSTSLTLLDAFIAAGGSVLFIGDPPAFVDAVSSPGAASLAARSTTLLWDRAAITAALRSHIGDSVAVVDTATGAPLSAILCQLRRDGERYILATLNLDRENATGTARLRLKLTGAARHVTEWDCRTGVHRAIDARTAGDTLEFTAVFAAGGEHVYVLTATPDPNAAPAQRADAAATRRIACPGPFLYTLAEPNVCVLDQAQWRIGEVGDWQGPAEILKVDQAVRRALDLPIRGGEMVQPWYAAKFEPAPVPRGRVALAFEFQVERLPTGDIWLCLEQPERFTVTINGHPHPTDGPSDWWVDIAFRRFSVPPDWLRPGRNRIVLETAFDASVDIEAIYLLGAFGVRTDGPEATLIALPSTLTVGDVATQGLPFYGAGITYHVPVPALPTTEGHVTLELPEFEAACVRVGALGAGPERTIAFPPYEADVTDVLAESPGSIGLEVVLTRRNTFGPLHQVPLRSFAYGPGNFTTEGEGFSEAYQFYPAGLLEVPVLRFGGQGKESNP